LDALLRAGKATISNAPEDKSKAMIKALMSTATSSYAYILKIRESLDPDAGVTRNAIQKLAKDVSIAVTEVVAVTGKLIPGGYMDAKDPNVIAERELLAAASAIDASAKELAILVPTPLDVEEGDELSFEEKLYDLSKAIPAATAALVRAATSVQRELGSKIVVKSMSGRNDLSESNGYFIIYIQYNYHRLVSSAKLVSSATQQLCENACTALNGKVNHERIIVSAKAVSTYTTQLLTATSVQSDQNSQNVIRLKAAAKAVTSATENLVRITEESLDSIDEEKISKVSKRNHSVVTAKILELDAQVNILKTEKELEKARNMLAAVRKGKYQERQEEMTTNNLMMRASKTAQKRPSGREMS
jgi:talin